MAPISFETPQGSYRSGIDYSVIHTRAWGYSIHTTGASNQMRLKVLEVLLCALGAVALLSVMCLWAGGSVGLSGVALLMKGALSFALVIAAVSLFDLADRGLCKETHFDTRRNEIRFVWRNRKGQMRLNTVVDVSEVASLFVRRRKMPLDLAVLYLRYGTQGNTVEVCSGEEHAMRALWEKINVDLSRAEPKRVSQSVARRDLQASKERRSASVNQPQRIVQDRMMRRNAVSSASSRLF